ncbi:MAG: 3-dehydroquinate synthase [Phycisphaerales bacterium]
MRPHATTTVRTPSWQYAVETGRGLLRHVGERMAAAQLRPAAAALVCDDAVEATAGAAVDASLRAVGARTARIAMQAREDAKTLATAGDLCERLLADGFDRASALVAVGGGVVGDVGGFVAATYMRGLPCVQAPTTLLAMVDASVGGKTAVNLVRADGTLAKNLIGVFQQPRLVVCDPEALGTLPPRELRSGLAECVKHALIADEPMLGWIESNADPLLAHDPDALGELVARNVAIKASIVAQDEREQGVRALLNLGHTFAHAIESLLHGACTHGEAVAIGTVAACRLGRELGIADAALESRVRALLERVGLPVALPAGAAAHPTADALLHAMAADKKKRDGALRLIVPAAPGDVRIVDAPDRAAILQAWRAVGAREAAQTELR